MARTTRGRAQKRADASGKKRTTAKTSRDARPPAENDDAEVTGSFSAPKPVLLPRLYLIICVVVLCGIGLVMVYSSSSVLAYSSYGDASYFLVRQFLWLGIGVIACVCSSCIPHTFWRNPAVAGVLWGAVVLLLAVLAFTGDADDTSGVGASESLGAVRTIDLGGVSFQPTEFAKIAVLLAFASLVCAFRERKLSFRRFFLLGVLCVFVPVILITQQPDLGTTVILIVGVLAVMALGGVRWRVIILIVFFTCVLVCIDCAVNSNHLDRVKALIDPWSYEDAKGYQIIQAFYAFGSGGLFGTGLGLSRQKYLYLPYAYNDFIYAIIGEEFGFVGCVIVAGLFLVFVYAGLRIARMAPDTFGCLIAGGMTVMIGFQAYVNIASVISLIPVTGKALPFISYGGSSLVASLIMVGIVLSVSRRSRVGVAHERRRDNLRVYEGAEGDVSKRRTGRTDRSAAREGDVAAASAHGRSHEVGGEAGQKGSVVAFPKRFSHPVSASGADTHAPHGREAARDPNGTGRLSYARAMRPHAHATAAHDEADASLPDDAVPEETDTLHSAKTPVTRRTPGKTGR